MRNESLFFSIVIPTFNRAISVGKTIQSITQQSFTDVEIIVVDDGSTDNTREIVEGLGMEGIRYLAIVNSERGAARNVGTQYAKGIYVNFFDSDDLFLPCLRSLQTFIESNNRPSVVYGDFQQVDGEGRELPKSDPPYSSFTRNLLHNNFLACGSVFLKHDVAQQFPFHENRKLSAAEDWELWLRVCAEHTFTHFPANIFQQVHHTQRSLVAIQPEVVAMRDTYFADLFFSNKQVEKFYGRRAIKLFMADRYTFIALAFCGLDYSKTFQFWMKSIRTTIFVMKRKRFWAIVKKLTLPWL
jgi:glycosyltransferase involved in cell wall biosynthesis